MNLKIKKNIDPILLIYDGQACLLDKRNKLKEKIDRDYNQI
jgi:hypothetical protein